MKNNENLTTAVVIVVIVVILTVSTSYYEKILSSQSKVSQNSIHRNESMANMMNFSEYKNGVYSTSGNYISPGGIEEIGVTLTLQNGVIIDSNVEVRAERDISVTMQNAFAANYKEQVVGKNIDEVNLTKVSGSSLTPNGFNDAIEKIKAQAKG